MQLASQLSCANTPTGMCGSEVLFQTMHQGDTLPNYKQMNNFLRIWTQPKLFFLISTNRQK